MWASIYGAYYDDCIQDPCPLGSPERFTGAYMNLTPLKSRSMTCGTQQGWSLLYGALRLRDHISSRILHSVSKAQGQDNGVGSLLTLRPTKHVLVIQLYYVYTIYYMLYHIRYHTYNLWGLLGPYTGSNPPLLLCSPWKFLRSCLKAKPTSVAGQLRTCLSGSTCTRLCRIRIYV